MADTRKDLPNPSRRAILEAGGALLGANLLSAATAPLAMADLAQPSLPATAPATPPPGYNILLILVDQEHHFDKWPFPVPGREYLKKYGTTFANHQGATQVCSSARSVIYTGRHIQHTGVFDNMEAPWQRDMSTNVLTVGHRLHQLGYHAAYQGKWHLSGTLDTAHQPIDAPLLKYREVIESYGFDDFMGLGDLIDGPIGGYTYDNFATAAAITWLKTKARELKAQGKPWFMAVNFVNPHDVMYVNSDAPGESVQGKAAAYPIVRRLITKFTAPSGTSRCPRRATSPSRRPAARKPIGNTRPLKTFCSVNGRTKTADGEYCKTTISTAFATATATSSRCSKN